MNTDFRVAVDFFTHHKARKLRKRLGASAVLSLLQLWAYAAKLRTDGNLSGMTSEDIELAAEWEGEDGAFAAALKEIGFIDVQRPSDGRQTNADDRSTIFDGAEIRLHDWADHNQWAADYDDRRDKARFSRLATVNRKAFEKLKTQGVTAISKNDYDMLTKAQRPSDGRQTNADVAPTPSPSPTPTYEENTHTIGLPNSEGPARATPDPKEVCGEENPTTPATEAPSIEFQELREYYNAHARQEAPLAGHPEYLQAKAAKTWPGQNAIYHAIDAHCRDDPQWKRGYPPGLGKFLRERWWLKKVCVARVASGQESGDQSTLAKNVATAKEVLRQRQARRIANA